MKDEQKITKKCVTKAGCESDCTLHEFSLQPLRSGLYHSQKSVLNLCPQYDKKSKTYFRVWPELNLDGKPHMPTFGLDIDRDSMFKKEKEYLQAQQERINNVMLTKGEILVPHPGKTRHTCFVCRSTFNDYRTHIGTKNHKSKLRGSRSQQSIHQLVSQVNRQYQSLLAPSAVSRRIRPQMAKLCKRQVKQQKIITKEACRLSELQSQIDDYMKQRQPTEPSMHKNEDDKAAFNYWSNQKSFRVSDYLV